MTEERRQHVLEVIGLVWGQAKDWIEVLVLRLKEDCPPHLIELRDICRKIDSDEVLSEDQLGVLRRIQITSYPAGDELRQVIAGFTGDPEQELVRMIPKSDGQLGQVFRRAQLAYIYLSYILEGVRGQLPDSTKVAPLPDAPIELIVVAAVAAKTLQPEELSDVLSMCRMPPRDATLPDEFDDFGALAQQNGASLEVWHSSLLRGCLLASCFNLGATTSNTAPQVLEQISTLTIRYGEDTHGLIQKVMALLPLQSRKQSEGSSDHFGPN